MHPYMDGDMYISTCTVVLVAANMWQIILYCYYLQMLAKNNLMLKLNFMHFRSKFFHHLVLVVVLH